MSIDKEEYNDQQLLLNPQRTKPSTVDQKTDKQPAIKRKQRTFWQWFCSNPCSKLPFIYFVVATLGVPALLVFSFMDPNTTFIILGTYIGVSLYGYKHFYTLIALRKQVNDFGSLNDKFHKEHFGIKKEVDKLSVANGSLRRSRDGIRSANARNRENLSQFNSLQENMKKMNLKSLDELTSIQSKAQKIGNRWQSQLIEQERDLLHTVFDRFEAEARGGSDGMNRTQFDQFSLQLPESYRKRFERLGTFDRVSSDGNFVSFQDFDVALDIFAEMEATDCDIEFEIEKNKSYQPSMRNISDNKNNDDDNDNDNDDDDDIDDIHPMKRWRTSRKSTKRKKKINIKVTKRTLRTEITHNFTAALGLAGGSFNSLHDDGSNSLHDDGSNSLHGDNGGNATPSDDGKHSRYVTPLDDDWLGGGAGDNFSVLESLAEDRMNSDRFVSTKELDGLDIASQSDIDEAENL